MKRPVLDMIAHVHSKIVSALWARQIARTGKHFVLGQGARIIGGRFIHVGERFQFGNSLWIEAVQEYSGRTYSPAIHFGDDVTGNDRVHIAAIHRVTLEDGVLLGSGIHITDHSHGSFGGLEQDSPYTNPARRRLGGGQAVLIGKNVWLGDGVVVLPGVTIGEGTIVGANSVVTRSLPAGVIAVGAPARPVKRYDAATSQWVPVND